MRRAILAVATGAAALVGSSARGGVYTRTYGDMDLVGYGLPGGADPLAGASLTGLAPGASSIATQFYGHGYPFSPGAGDFPGTDQIYVGSNQTGAHDGYSVADSRLSGPQVLVLDLTGLAPAGEAVTTVTLGIATDDFQNAVYGQPFAASVNGVPDAALTALLNSLDETTPIERFLTIGLDPSVAAGGSLTLTIDEGGDGGDGWAVDYLTVGLTTTAVPEPGAGLALAGASALGLRRRR